MAGGELHTIPFYNLRPSAQSADKPLLYSLFVAAPATFR